MADDKQKKDEKGVGAAVGTGTGGQQGQKQQGQNMPGRKQDDQQLGHKGTPGSQPYNRDQDQNRQQQKQPQDKKGGYESERR